jgi:hypothetical protein
MPAKDDSKKFKPAVEMGKKGGKVGGPARAKALKPARRTEIASHAACVRWHGKQGCKKGGGK